jgi:ribosome biogenesis GTPase A
VRTVSALLAQAKAAIPFPSHAQAAQLAKLDELQARLDDARLRVAALGQFKRGKSTLLNALLGAPILPMGVTPVTAIPTFIRAGEALSVRIVLKDERGTVVVGAGEEAPRLLEEFTSETQNPHNRRRVADVTIEAPSDFLAEGVILVDTPGVGSTFLHNTTAAESALADCDAALFVLSADPPITEVEIDYLEKVRKLVPRIFFVLNKADLLEDLERTTAERFLASVLRERGFAAPEGIFVVSSRRARRAQLNDDARALEQSGVADLERALASKLAREKRSILDVTGRQRLGAVISDLLFQSEFECKALLTPEDELRRKAETFESSAHQFESERRRLSDLLSLDRRELLRDLEAHTDQVWNEARAEAHRLIDEIDDSRIETPEARAKIAEALAAYFENSLGEEVGLFRDRVDSATKSHSDRAGVLINLVRQTAADLLDIPVSATHAEEVFQAAREPYWVAPEPIPSLIDVSASVAALLLPRKQRQRRARKILTEQAERAALRNVANLEWSLRQNIEDSVRRFETLLTDQLGLALQATREALQIAQQKRATRSEAIEAEVAEAKRAIATLSAILSELHGTQTLERSLGAVTL